MNNPNIEVGIMSETSLEIFLNGNFLSGETKLSGDFSVEISEGKIELKNTTESFVFRKEVVFQPENFNQNNFILKKVMIGVDFHWQQKEDQKFQGSLKFLLENGKINAINVLPVENYLISVISSEMRGDSSLALLKAHAIISRSWLLAQIRKQAGISEENQHYQSTFESETEYIRWWDREDHANFHVCADDHCQRYQGITRAENPNVVKAVNETSGMVLMHNGKIADARFSKCCGGVSELFENCWENKHHAYLEKVVDSAESPKNFQLDLENEEKADNWLRNSPDAFCNTNDPAVLKQVLNDYDQSANFYRWKVEYSQAELSALIKRRSGKDFGQIVDLIPMERGVSGRLTKLKIVGTKRTLTIGKELVIRRWLSESHLYSSAFVIDKTGDNEGLPKKFSLTGGGWGHGVGLCQIGAAVMGHKGYSYKEILSHYFKNVTVSKEY